MTDEGSAPPAPSAPEPAAPPPAAEHVAVAPTLTPAPEPVPVVSQEAVQQISSEITEAVQEAIVDAAAPVSKPAPASPTPAAQSQPAASVSSFNITAMQPQALRKKKENKRARMEKIFELRATKNVITNDDVQRHLNVSNATATNYLRELVRDGRLRRFGVKRGIRYEFV